MKPTLLLRLLLLTRLAPQLVSGSPKQHFLRYILEPPPCRSDPENCTHFCTLQEDCHQGFQCCSAFCGIVCTLNKKPCKIVTEAQTRSQNTRKAGDSTRLS